MLTQRPSRDKKKTPYSDELYDCSGVTDTKEAAPKRKSISTQKHQHVKESQDPFVLMKKHIIEPIFQYEKLELLASDKV